MSSKFLLKLRQFNWALHRSLRRRGTSRWRNGQLLAPKVFGSGSRIYQSYRPDWDVEFSLYAETKFLAHSWAANNEQNNAGDIPRFYALILNVNQVLKEGVSGDFAELGVYRGNSATILAHYCREYKRSLFLFDTFTGFDRRDVTGVDAQAPQAFSDTSLDMVRAAVGTESVSFMKGFFPGTITDDVERRRFAVVHLDCDLYEPMKAGLEFFYPRLSPGGLIILHDYFNPHWAGAKQAVDEYLARISDNLILAPDKSGTAMLRKSREPTRPVAAE